MSQVKEAAIQYAIDKINDNPMKHLNTLQRIANYQLGFFNESDWPVTIKDVKQSVKNQR